MRRRVAELKRKPPAGEIQGGERSNSSSSTASAAEAADCNSERVLRSMLDNAPAFIAYLDTECRYVQVSHAYESLLGAAAKRIRGKHIREVFGEEHYQRLRPRIERVLAGERISFEWRATPPNGEERDLAATYTPDRDERGNVCGFVVHAQDVTERKSSADALRTREEQYQTLLANLPDVVSRFDRNLRFLYTSPAVERSTGFPPGHFIGKTHAEAGIPEELSARLEAKLREIFETGENGHVDLELARPDGALRRYFGIGVPEREPDGSVRSVLTIVRDVTERKQAEQALRESQEHSHSQLAELEHIYRTAPVGIGFVDTNLRFVRINERLAEINGFSVQEHIGRGLTEILPKMGHLIEPSYRQVIESGEPILDLDVEGPTKAIPDDQHSYRVSYYPVKNPAGKVLGVTAVVQDVTRQKQTERELEKLNQELAQRVREFDALLNVIPIGIHIAHDPECRRITLNRYFYDVLGVEPGANVSKSPLAGEPVAPYQVYRNGRELSAEELPMHKAVRTRAEVRNEEMDMVGTDGRTITLYGHAAPLFDEKGRVTGALSALLDITERKRAEQERVELLRREQELRGHTERALALKESVERQLMLLVEASSTLLASPESAEVLRTILAVAMRFIEADAYAVWRKSEERAEWNIVAKNGLSESYSSTVVDVREAAAKLSGGPIAVEDIEQSAFVGHRASEYAAEGIRALLTVPLRIHGTATGTVVFYYRTPHRFTEVETRVAGALGNLAAAALGTAELYERQTELRAMAQAAERRARFVAEAGELLSSSLEYETTLRSVAKLAIPAFADWCAVDVSNGDRLERVTVEHADPAKIQLALEYRRKYPPREDDISEQAFRSGQAVLIEHIPEQLIAEQIRDPEQLRMVRALNIRSLIVAPIVARGRTLGLLTFVSSQPGRQYAKADLALAEELARRAGIAIDNARLYAEVSGNEELTRTITENTSAALFMTDSRGRCTYINQAGEAMTGFTAAEILGNGLHDLIHHTRPDGTAYLVADCPIDRALPLNKNVQGHEDMFVRKDGTFYPVRCFASPIFKGRMPVGTVIEVRDITEERRAVKEREDLLRREQDARQTAEALNRVGPLLSVELDSQRLAEKITDLATRLIGAEFGALFHNVINENGESYTLYTLAGVPYEAFANFPMPRNTAVFGPTFRGEKALRSDDITKDPRYGRNAPHYGMPEGHLPVRSYLAVPVVSRSGEVLGGLFFGHSRTGVFTERAEDLVTGIAAQAAIALDNARLFKQSEQTQEALRRSNEDLRRANDDLNQFAYSASHDLQEPLRMVALYSQMLQKKYRGRLDAQADEFIGYTVQGARRLEMLVKDLLDYTHAANFATEDLTAVDANEILDNTLASLRRSVEESDAVVTHEKLPAVYIQEIHLVQLFQNLIGNALKYRGKDRAYVKISAARQDAAWLFSVQDNGIGIDPQYKEQIFGLFKRLHTAAEYSGTGIGLAICQKIVERYGGNIWVESTPGEGATFYFTVPDKEPKTA